jgi:hypothetical protein
VYWSGVLKALGLIATTATNINVIKISLAYAIFTFSFQEFGNIL